MPDYTDYTVTLRFLFPAWDEVDGIAFEVSARNKAEAIRYAKRQAQRDGHAGFGGKGRETFKAEEAGR